MATAFYVSDIPILDHLPQHKSQAVDEMVLERAQLELGLLEPIPQARRY